MPGCGLSRIALRGHPQVGEAIRFPVTMPRGSTRRILCGSWETFPRQHGRFSPSKPVLIEKAESLL